MDSIYVLLILKLFLVIINIAIGLVILHRTHSTDKPKNENIKPPASEIKKHKPVVMDDARASQLEREELAHRKPTLF